MIGSDTTCAVTSLQPVFLYFFLSVVDDRPDSIGRPLIEIALVRSKCTIVLRPTKRFQETRRGARGSTSRRASLEGKRFERFIEELSASFVRSSVDEIGGEIDRWIREIVLGLDLDRGALSQIDAKSGKLAYVIPGRATAWSNSRSASSCATGSVV